MLRWQLEVTFQEARAHLGVATQRQWSDRAIARTTPVLFGLFSWISPAAHLLQQERPATPRSAAWCAKSLPTFADAIAAAARSRKVRWEGRFLCQGTVLGRQQFGRASGYQAESGPWQCWHGRMNRTSMTKHPKASQR